MENLKYEYDGKVFNLKRLHYKKYLKKTQVKEDKLYSIKEAEEIINLNVLKCYKGAFHPEEKLTGKDICELLSDIEETFDIRLHECFVDQ